jgi:hypothetical protein
MDLNRLLKELVPEWFQFGIQLKIPIDELKWVIHHDSWTLHGYNVCNVRYNRKIESNMRPEDDNKFTDMLEKWLEYSTEVRSWDMISTGLECIGNRRLAIQIKHDYGSCNVDKNDLTLLQNTLKKDCISRWYDFGIALGVPKVKLDAIDDRPLFSVYLSHTLEWWYNNGVYCWEPLIKAVRDTGNGRLANELEQKYLK